jgi:putative ABC transport system permease protein
MSEKRSWKRLPRIGRSNVEAEVHAEVESHLAMQVADLVREGWSEEEARAEAYRRFGERTRIEREMRTISHVRERETRRAQWWEAVWQDARYGARLLRRSPGFAAVVVLTLALGIGANTAVFSAVDAALLRPLPFGEPDNVVSVWSRYVPESGEDHEWMSLSAPELRDYRASARAVSDVAAYTTRRVNLAGGEAAPDRVAIAAGGANLFDVLRVRPVLGRTFREGEDAAGAPCVVVIGHGFWQARFAASATALGQTIRLDGEPCEVIGVMPAGFFFPDERARLWRPLAIAANPELAESRGSHWLAAVARLAPNMTLEHAEAELGPLMRAWRQADDHHIGHFVVLRPFRDDVVGDQRMVLVLLLGAVGLVLLIICANLANLLLTRAEGRRRELAVRVALGAGQGRLTWQLLTESMLVVVSGGVLALLVAHILVRLLPGLGEGSLPAAGDFALNGRVLAFTATISLLTGVLFGFLPALQAPARRIQETLRTEGRGATVHGRTARVRSVLVVVEIALSLAVVSAAALLARSYDRLRRVELGMTDENVLVLDVTLTATDYAAVARTADFFATLRTAVAALPGVHSAGLVSDLPLRSQPGMDSFRIEGRPDPQPGEPSFDGGYVMATPGYFESLGIPLVAGRALRDGDVRGAPFVAVVDELAARTYWPGVDPIGQRIRYYDTDAPWLTIVGVVGTVRYLAPQLDPRPAVYGAHAQVPRSGFYTGRSMTLVVRATSQPESLVLPIRDLVRRLDPQVPVTNVALMEDVIGQATGRPRFATTLMGLFALASLLVGAIGIYGVLSYLVRARTQEIGIRIALGASAGSVHRMVLRQGVLLALVGIAIGAAASLASRRLLASLLYDVSPSDPLTLLSVPLVLGAVALLASYFPARRATRIDPASALRSD